MPTQQLHRPDRQPLPCTITTGSIPSHVKSWILDGKIRQLSPGTLQNRQLITDKLLWFLKQWERKECDVAELKSACPASGMIKLEADRLQGCHRADRFGGGEDA